MTNTEPRIAVCSRSFSQNQRLKTELLSRFKNVKFNDLGLPLTGDTLIDFLKECDAAIIALERIDSDTISKLPQLKVISKYGVGLDSIDLDALKAYDVELAWSAGVNKRCVAELTVCFILGSLHLAFYSNHVVRNNNWHQVIGSNLSQKTVGIIGLGNVGTELVRLLQPFDCTILANDIVDKSSVATDFGVKLVALNHLLAESDVVSIHIPLTHENQLWFDATSIECMKQGAVLINAARGNIVDEGALLAALDSGKLSCAAFDVFSQEPLLDKRLIDHPRLFCTSHIGGSSKEAILAMGMAAIEGLSSKLSAHQEAPLLKEAKNLQL